MQSINGLYSEEKVFDHGKLLLTASVIKHSAPEIIISLYEKCLTEGNGKRSIPFDFDLKYAFTTQPPTLTFERTDEKVTYEMKS